MFPLFPIYRHIPPSLVRFYLLQQQQQPPQQQQRHNRQRRRIIMLSIDASRSALAWPPADLTGLYDFTDGTAGTSIGDGGNDMYDGGNMIRVQAGSTWSNNLQYTNQCNGDANSVATGDVMYETCKQTNGLSSKPLFFAVFSSVSSSITGVQIQGALVAMEAERRRALPPRSYLQTVGCVAGISKLSAQTHRSTI